MILLVLLRRFGVITLPLINLISSLNDSCFPFLTPLNLNFESLGLSSTSIFKNMIFAFTSKALIFISVKSSCSHRFFNASEISSPGIFISCPTSNPLIAINAEWSRF